MPYKGQHLEDYGKDCHCVYTEKEVSSNTYLEHLYESYIVTWICICGQLPTLGEWNFQDKPHTKFNYLEQNSWDSLLSVIKACFLLARMEFLKYFCSARRTKFTSAYALWLKFCPILTWSEKELVKSWFFTQWVKVAYSDVCTVQ